MFRRIIRSIADQAGRSLLLILLMFILSISLSVSFLIRQGGINVNSEFLNAIKPEAVLTGKLSYKSTSDFVGLYIRDNSLEDNNAYTRDFYNDMMSIKEELNPDYFDIDMSMFSTVPCIVYADDKYLVSDERQYREMQLLEVSSSGGRYPRLISVSNADYTDLHYFGSSIKKGRTFNAEDIYSVIVPENLYLSDGDSKYSVNIGDYLTINFFNAGTDERETLAEYYLEVVGIVSDSKQIARDSYNIHNTLIIPEALFKIITDDIYPLVKDSLYRFGYYDSITFYPVYMTLNNLEDIFRLNDMINEFNTFNKNYIFTSDAMDYAMAYGEIKSIVANLNSLFYVSLIVNIMIMFFIFKQDIENRKQEIGILMALGLNGRMISVQFYLEYLFICLFSFVVSLPLSNVLINRMSTVFGFEFKLMAMDYFLLGSIIVLVFTASALISFISINKFSVKEILNNE